MRDPNWHGFRSEAWIARTAAAELAEQPNPGKQKGRAGLGGLVNPPTSLSGCGRPLTRVQGWAAPGAPHLIAHLQPGPSLYCVHSNRIYVERNTNPLQKITEGRGLFSAYFSLECVVKIGSLASQWALDRNVY